MWGEKYWILENFIQTFSSVTSRIAYGCGLGHIYFVGMFYLQINLLWSLRTIFLELVLVIWYFGLVKRFPQFHLSYQTENYKVDSVSWLFFHIGWICSIYKSSFIFHIHNLGLFCIFPYLFIGVDFKQHFF